MSWYRHVVLPHILDFVLRSSRYVPYRKRAVEQASGRVLEIGMGSGLNLPYYTDRVTEVIGFDPEPKLLEMASRQPAATVVRILQASAESIPLRDHSVDTVVTTWTLCSIPSAGAALRELRRVLKQSGRLLFVEHGRAPTDGVRRWQARLTPAWKRLAGGCHLDRPIPQLIKDAGFAIEQMETEYIAGPKPLAFTYQGWARPLT
jgi:ubiquinone/menaquinone biosynthesis C-methylase UbiE